MPYKWRSQSHRARRNLSQPIIFLIPITLCTLHPSKTLFRNPNPLFPLSLLITLPIPPFIHSP